jgi:hypothetical protein
VSVEPLQAGNWYVVEYVIGSHRYGMAARVEEVVTDGPDITYIMVTPTPVSAIIPVLHRWLVRAQFQAVAYGDDLDADREELWGSRS